MAAKAWVVLRQRWVLWKNCHYKGGLKVAIDEQGYRANVGIILSNESGQLFWARRVGQDAWQFPQGGIRVSESPEEAMFRELREEVGLKPEHVRIEGATRRWLRYRLPKNLVRQDSEPVCIGQKQRWYLLRLLSAEHHVCLNVSTRPEFDNWCWIDYWQPVKEVIYFKRHVYKQALQELAPLVFQKSEV